MRIACPNCSADYDVPDPLLAGGPRLLRCARCGHQFQAGTEAAGEAPVPPPSPPAPPPEAPAAAAAQPLPEPVAAAPPPAAEVPPAAATPPPSESRFHDRIREADVAAAAAPRTGAALAAAWFLSFAVLGAGGWAGYRYRADIVEAWPPAARFYQAVGLE